MELNEIEKAIEGILFASGESMPVKRIAEILQIESEEVLSAADRLADAYSLDNRGIKLIKLEGSLQLVSVPELAPYIRAALEMRKPPQLSQSAMEALAVVAYFQPVTRAYVEQVRGVDSSYTMGILQDRGLIEPCGRLQVPGRPVLFRTTKVFLRSFGISSLDDLPPMPDITEDMQGQLKLEQAIAELTSSEPEEEEKEQ
ncbi:MAG: SMC-Scp complex subunit ScpB [Oscillospiraceae bacterium]|nr:SMC-Scp complex subunit ScpB [Oscillospiraceae bacterium]